MKKRARLPPPGQAEDGYGEVGTHRDGGLVELPALLTDRPVIALEEAAPGFLTVDDCLARLAGDRDTA